MDFLTILAVAAAAALASPIGGAISLWRTPTTLFMSSALGFASGVLLATIGFEMLPQARTMSPLGMVCGGFVAGFAGVYSFDLIVHHGLLVGSRAEQRPQVERFQGARRRRGGEVTVLAGGTSIEELIEGLSIGVGVAIKPGLGLVIALAIFIDNLSEGLSIGEIIRSEAKDSWRAQVRRILGWTSLIGVALISSTLVGWLIQQDMSRSLLGFLLASGGGGMFYLVISDLVPQAEERHYQQSAAVATALGFLAIFILSDFA